MNKLFVENVLKVQNELKAPKSKYNDFGKYHYRSCEDILEAAKPILGKYGLMLTITDKTYETPSGWHFVEATATLTDGESLVSVSASARESNEKKGMDASQITGTASSYARKYALNGLFLIDDAQDADTNEYAQETGKKQPKAPEKEPITMAQMNEMSNLCVTLKKPLEEISKAYKVNYLNELTKAQGDAAIKRLKELVAAKK